MERRTLDGSSAVSHGSTSRRSSGTDQVSPASRLTAGAGLLSRSDLRSEQLMLTYIIRRLLYSILVLIAASLLVFTFVAKARRPARRSAITPNVVAD